MASGRFRDSRHAEERKVQRDVDLHDVEKVIKTGWHEPGEDRYKEEHESWSYAIRGKTVDGIDIRVVVAFDDEDYLVVVTARPP
jgi:hypothetical protein